MTDRRWRPTYIALGSNLDDPMAHLQQAVFDLHAIPGLRVFRTSSIVRSAPLDGSDQPDYLNAVVGGLTNLAPLTLLHACKAIEKRHGRKDDAPLWSARPLDLDIIALGDTRCEQKTLSLPHPGAQTRAFVLLPLLDVAPFATIPGLGCVATLTAQIDRANVEMVGRLNTPQSSVD